jgi:hypothetical protein
VRKGSGFFPSVAAAACMLAGLAGCARPEPKVLRLATTTSTYDSGLLDAILPDFESRHDAWVDGIAVGTGKAIALARTGTRMSSWFTPVPRRMPLWRGETAFHDTMSCTTTS